MLCVSPIRKEFFDLVLHHRPAARFEDNDGSFRIKHWTEDFHKPQQVFFRHVEKAVVVQRASAADITLWEDDIVSKVLEDFDRCFCCLGEEVVVECVRKKQN